MEQTKSQQHLRPLKGVRWMAVADTHGHHIDPCASRVALAFEREWKPEIRVHLGDGVDLDPLRNRASQDEQMGGINDDMQAGIEFNRLYRPTHYLLGNHDYRLQRAMESPRNILAELAVIMWNGFRNSLGDCKVYPYCKRRGVMRLKDYALIHGYSAGIYAARKAALSYGNVMMGHVHRVDAQPVERFDGAIGRSIGCLCDLLQDYNRGQLGTLSQAHGFAFGVLRGHKCIPMQAQKIDGQWVMPVPMEMNNAPS